MNERRVLTATLLALAAGVGFWTCKSSSSTTPDPPVPVIDDPSFASDIQTIFTTSCALSGCHAPGSAQGGLVLASGQAYANIVNVDSTEIPAKKRIVPGDAANSYLVLKIEGNQTSGSRMPPNGPLDSNRIQNIKNWVAKGAKNN
jgi:hypothetical protein